MYSTVSQIPNAYWAIYTHHDHICLNELYFYTMPKTCTNLLAMTVICATTTS